MNYAAASSRYSLFALMEAASSSTFFAGEVKTSASRLLIFVESGGERGQAVECARPNPSFCLPTFDLVNVRRWEAAKLRRFC
jgi:hypothetical protein